MIIKMQELQSSHVTGVRDTTEVKNKEKFNSITG